MISIRVFCCWKKVFTHTSTWMIGKNRIKHYYQRKIFLQPPKHGRCYWRRSCPHKIKFGKNFEIKNLGKYQDLYVQNDTLLLAEVFKDFPDTCFSMFGLDPARFLSTPGLAWQALLKRTKVKWDQLFDIDMEYVMLFINKWKLMTNIWTIVIKIKNHCVLSIGICIVYLDGQCHRS